MKNKSKEGEIKQPLSNLLMAHLDMVHGGFYRVCFSQGGGEIECEWMK